MTYVLTVNSNITCAHNASVQLQSSTKLTVAGANVLLLSDIVGASITACPTPNDTSKGLKQCLKVASASGIAAKLTVGGQHVVNDTFAGTSDGTSPPAPAPLPLTLVSVGHTKLSAV
jgi:hypothetical protein